MADILDDADKASEMFQLEALTKKKPTGPAPTGRCHCCGEEFPSGSLLRFCDADCRAWWDQNERATNLRREDRDEDTEA